MEILKASWPEINILLRIRNVHRLVLLPLPSFSVSLTLIEIDIKLQVDIFLFYGIAIFLGSIIKVLGEY